MSKKDLKKEVKRLNKIIDVLLKENRSVWGIQKKQEFNPELQYLATTTTTNDYIGGRPNDRVV